VRSEGFYVNKKNPLTLARIEPVTFRFVAQHLNHCATACKHRAVIEFLTAENFLQLKFADECKPFVVISVLM